MKNKLLIVIVAGLLLNGCSLYQTQQTNNTNKKESGNNIDVEQNKKTIKNNKLNLGNQNLQKIPEYIFEQKNLEELDVSNNRISGAIQGEIRHLQNLKVLKASNNQMTGVPAEIGQLKNLQLLDLSNNQLTGLPYELGNLQNLEILDISGNNYSELDLGTIQEKLSKNVIIIK